MNSRVHPNHKTQYRVSARGRGGFQPECELCNNAAFQRRVRQELGLVDPLSRAVPATPGSRYSLRVPPHVANPCV